MRQAAALLIAVLLVVPGAFAVTQVFNGLTLTFGAPDYVQRDASLTVPVQVYDGTGNRLNGSTTNCSYNVYGRDGSLYDSGMMNGANPAFSFTLNESNTSTSERLGVLIDCTDGTNAAQWSGGIEVTPTGLPYADGEDLTPMAMLVLAPMLLALILLGGAATLNPEKHSAAKVFLFLLSTIPFYFSTWWGTLLAARFYPLPDFIDGVGQGTFYWTLLFIVIVLYFVIYTIYVMFMIWKEKKAERLRY